MVLSVTVIAMNDETDMPVTERLRVAESELVRLREFIQWVADHSIDPLVIIRARQHGAE